MRQPTVNPNTRRYRAAEEDAEFVAVCIIGTGCRVPRGFGDNEGAHPLKVCLTAERDPEKSAPKDYNRGAHTHPYQTLCYVWVRTWVRARRVKAKLDQMLFGAVDATEMLAGFVDCEGWMAELLLGQALEDLRFEALDEAGKQQKIAANARRGR